MIREQAVYGSWGSAGLRMPIHVHFCRRATLTSKVSQTDLVLVCNKGSLVSLCVQDHKSLCAAVNIRATLVDCFCTFWSPTTLKLSLVGQTRGDSVGCYTYVRCTYDANLVTVLHSRHKYLLLWPKDSL